MLQARLDEITQNTRKLVQAERLVQSEQIIADLFATNIEANIVAVGTQAPAFQLPDAINGKLVRSSDLLALGPVVLKFFRGRWDPYCVTELEAWRDLYPELRRRGALLVAISPQTVRQSDFTVQQHGLPYPLLHDAGCGLADQFGIAYPGHTRHGSLLPLHPREPAIHQPWQERDGDRRTRLAQDLPCRQPSSLTARVRSSSPKPMPIPVFGRNRKTFSAACRLG